MIFVRHYNHMESAMSELGEHIYRMLEFDLIKGHLYQERLD